MGRRTGRDTGAPRLRRKRPWLVGELAIVFVLLEVYGYVRKMAHTRYEAALSHGREILAIEDHLALDFEVDANRWLHEHHDLAQVAVWLYQHMHTGLTMWVLLACYLFGPDIYRPARNALVLTNLVGLLVFFVLPVMPPRLLPHRGYIDSVAHAGFGTTHSPPVPADQYAAMPSLHMAWALWVALVIMTMLHRYRVRWVFLLHPITTAVVVVVTANHYVLDVVAGVAVAMATVLGTGLVWARSGTAYAGGQLVARKRSAPGSASAALDAEAVEDDRAPLVPDANAPAAPEPADSHAKSSQ
ncbi:phosphatase PAP2 family protein [Actinomadura monticuli]|uniref:Phosphatase PAP2 family protein n=1 Tax=Actinomadura monticuli TaxID=3097367 RepID=A0ABV4QB35_9ACTN